MRRLLVLALFASGCIDFDAIAVEACSTKKLCSEEHPTEPVENLGYCAPCMNRLQCGGGSNRCVTVGAQAPFCGVECASDGGCAAGSSCGRVLIEDGGRVLNCLPTFPLQCDGGIRPGVTDAGALDGGRDAGVDAGTDAGSADAGPGDAGSADAGLADGG